MRTPPTNFPQEILPHLLSYLERLRAKGVKSLYLDDTTAAPAGRSEAPAPEGTRIRRDDTAASDLQEATRVPRDTEDATHTKEAPMPATPTSATVVSELNALAEQVAVCTECGLHKGRTKSVFGVGTHKTKVMFIGEGPGRDEDLKGEPFVGRSGQLLTKILAAIDLQRKDVYIMNIVKCRPPENRDP